MGLFSTLFGCKNASSTATQMNDTDRFVEEKAFQENLAAQRTMTPQTVQQLRKAGVGPERMLKVEYFFYSNTLAKAEELAKDLKALGYTADARDGANVDGTFLATGMTPPLSMSDSAMIEWTERMCTIGFQHDCDFDGWGTDPSQ